MKTNCWLILGLMVATSAVAQNNTNTLPAIARAGHFGPGGRLRPRPPPPAPAPSPPSNTRNTPPRPKSRAVEGTHGRARCPARRKSRPSNLIVRGQAGLKGEVVTHLSKGDAVTVLSQINLDKHADRRTGAVGENRASRPMPMSGSTRKYLTQPTRRFLRKKLNLRAGPGENYSVLGVIEQGTPVSAVNTKGDWMKIEAARPTPLPSSPRCI